MLAGVKSKVKWMNQGSLEIGKCVKNRKELMFDKIIIKNAEEKSFSSNYKKKKNIIKQFMCFKVATKVLIRKFLERQRILQDNLRKFELK